MVNWLQLEPPLVDVNLAPYYYLTRESLKLNIVGGRRLSQEQQVIFAELNSGSSAARQSAAKRLAVRSADEIYGVYDALWTRVLSNPKGSKALDGLFELARQHEGSAKRLLEGIHKLPPTSIEGRSVPKVAVIRQDHPSLSKDVNAQLTEWASGSVRGVATAAKAVLEAKSKEQ